MAGLDFTALNGRFGFNVDGYYRKTTDLLSEVAIAGGTNFSDKTLEEHWFFGKLWCGIGIQCEAYRHQGLRMGCNLQRRMEPQ